jgi:hypothetical protein
METTTYMIIERFKGGNAVPVYRRFRDHGRLSPAGLKYVSSWVNESVTCCYQVMETHDRKLLDQWMDNWKDIVEFEVHPVISSEQAARKMSSEL